MPYCWANWTVWLNQSLFQRPSSPEEHFVIPAPNPTLTPLYPDWLSISKVSCICPFEAPSRVTPPHPWITGTLPSALPEIVAIVGVGEGAEKSLLGFERVSWSTESSGSWECGKIMPITARKHRMMAPFLELNRGK